MKKLAFIFLLVVLLVLGIVSAIECGDTITENTILTEDLVGCTGDGLIIDNNGITLDCNNHVIEGVGNSFTSGIALSDKSGISGVTIKNCVIRNFGYRGIDLHARLFEHSNSNNIITNNIVTLNKCGIYLSSRSSRYNQIINNTISSNFNDGIFFDWSDSNKIINNTINSNGDNGIQINGFSDMHGSNNQIINNVINYNGNSGIFFDEAYNSNITENKIKNNGGGIALGSSKSNQIINNTINFNDYGIKGYQTTSSVSSSYNNIVGNIINSNEGDGVYILYGSYNEIIGNLINSNMGRGVWLGNSYSYSEIINNTINSNENEGLYLSSSRYNLVKKNNINLNKQSGIYVAGSSYNEFTENTINSNEFGFYFLETVWHISTENVINYSNIYNNRQYNIYNYQPGGISQFNTDESRNVSAENNWWGTTVQSEIEEKIYDCEDDEELGCVNFTTYLIEPWNHIPVITCYDGIKNGYEEGVDCGWICGNNCGRCISIISNGDSDNKIDVVFIGSGFTDLNKFEEVVNDAIDYDGNNYGLMSVEPFKSYKERFNFWLVNELQTFSEDDYESQPYKLAKEACPQMDQFILLSVEPRFISHAYLIPYTGIGMKKAFVTVGNEYLIDNDWPLDIEEASYGDSKEKVIRTLVHEFGHSFGGLNDEYDFNENNLLSPLLTPNCDEESCDKWSDIEGTGCYQVCGYSNWYRAYINTIMRNQYKLDATFKQVNENELEDDINGASTLMLNQYENNEDYDLSYVLDLHYEDGIISNPEIELITGETSILNEGDYVLKIISFDDNELFSFNFNFSLEASFSPSSDWFDENGNQIIAPDEPAITQLTETDESFSVPYLNNAKEIKIYDLEDTLLLTIDISQYHDKDEDKILAVVDNCPNNYNPEQRSPRQGDANCDGKIDGQDLAIWQQNYDPLGLNENTFEMADWNLDGRIDGSDLALWQSNYDPLGIHEVLSEPEPEPEPEIQTLEQPTEIEEQEKTTNPEPTITKTNKKSNKKITKKTKTTTSLSSTSLSSTNSKQTGVNNRIIRLNSANNNNKKTIGLNSANNKEVIKLNTLKKKPSKWWRIWEFFS